ncbi:hypothetical protein KDX16_16185 [Burkholderia vietnamiensis]|jgi:hypothetical protein|uniref:Uncharacterized protein n=1 Tax=Burkholderia aenigmatica TaxID=2015348 RepID=A0A6P2T946_9BURK|nr:MULTISPECIES: hypothetical protein [Burkholderia cepacia complex]HDR9756630.1 hypothetical protein [Burkholderia cepacia ATCC 25416]MBR7917364.1 hypothetical protein [Burkholderia vietnamiensis]MBR8054328.1 hypothetical protein [Burkholderia vietnamiensis]VWC52660.1 hypothetical protein BLA13014_08018 [Burkholderia aenigmatica]HDR9789624.1 hypothetical protein [Burkholderia cepacia ATCC 25416]
MHETKIPQSVQFYVKHALSVLREQEAALHGVQLARGKGHILALELQDREGKIKRAMERLDEFRGHAAINGVDADTFLNECGGVPDFEKFGYPKPVQIRRIEQDAYDATACGIKLVGRPIHVGERDLLIGRENAVLSVRGPTGNVVFSVSPSVPWTGDAIVQSLNHEDVVHAVDGDVADAYLGDCWIGGTEV